MEKILQEIGFSEAESKIYLFLVKNGKSKSGEIINENNLQSSTTYRALESLIKRGIVSYILIGKIKMFQAEDPKNIIKIMEDKTKELKEKISEISKEKQEPSTARVFEGILGLKVAFNDILETMKKGEEYFFFFLPKENLYDERNLLFLKNYHIKRSSQGINVRALSTTSSKKAAQNTLKGLSRTKLRYVDDFLPTGIVLYKNKMITIDWKDKPIAIVIQNKTIVDSYKRFFEEKWKIAK